MFNIRILASLDHQQEALLHVWQKALYHYSNRAAEFKVMFKVTEERMMSHHCKDLCRVSYLISSGDKGALIDAELSSWHDGAYIICR